MERPVPARLTPSEGRRFAFPVGGVFLILGGVFAWRGHLVAAQVAGALGGLLVAAGILVPGSLGPVYRAWMGLAVVISRITTPIFMALVYYLVITPTGLIRRTVGSSQIVHTPVDDSYWQRREEGRRRGDLERQF